jgi:outer membrane protein TolC
VRAAVFALVLGLSFTARAATLKELLEAAERHNVDRRISLEQRRRAATELSQAWSALLPSVSAQGGWTHNQYASEVELGPGREPLVILPRNQFDATVRVELPLVDTARWFRAAAAEALEEGAGYRDALTRDNVARQVATTYYSHAAALALRASAQRSVEVAEAQLRLQEIRLTAGAAMELELLRARAEQQRTRQTLTDTEVLVANTRRALRTLTGVEVDEATSLPEDQLAAESSLEELEARTGELPAVRAAEKDAEAAEVNARAARFVLVPNITAHFTERITNATGFSGQVSSYTAGLGLIWRLDAPTFFNMSVQSSNAAIASLAAERQRLNSQDQIHNDWQRLNAAIGKLAAARTQVESAQRAAKLAQDRYAAGAATQLDVIQAERDLFAAEVNHIQSRTELASTRVSLRLSAGLPPVVE